MERPVAFLLNAPDGDVAESWVQVAKTGTFKDPRYGQFKITLADYDRWIKNFHAISLAEGHLGLPVDVDHSPEKRGDTEAVGWVKELEKRQDELWARVEWNPVGKTLVAERRYAYISPSYSPNFQDESGKSHGTALVGIALTNRPFLSMATVNLSTATFAAQVAGGDDVGISQDDINDLDDTMLDVSEPERQKHAVVVKKIGGKTKHMFPIPPGDRVHARLAKAFLPRAIAAGHITDEEAAAVRRRADDVLGSTNKQHSAYSHRQMELTELLTTLNLSRTDLGVAEDAEEAVVLSAIASRVATPAASPKVPEGHVILSAEQVATLSAQAAAGAQAATQLHEDRFEAAFTAAQTAGKVVLSQKDTFKAMYGIEGNAANTLKLLSDLKPAISMTPNGVGGASPDLDPQVATLAGDYSDVVTNMPVDQEGLKVLAKAGELQAATPSLSFDRALELAQAGS